ncbi:hypothetical protein MNB_SV-15-766 [hydrothermal vent metagenome]|uniref:Methyl-accepting chemotaxis protein n=1 Tax=hydrothermal vent metagenome TaxID=652676 RepID=A0A1W1EKB2_9ZZZZ
MKREELLEKIQDTKASHLINMRKINTIIKNQYFINKPPHTLAKECSIENWLENRELSVILGSIFYSELVKNHTKWHEVYEDLYNKFFDSKKLQQIIEKIENPKNDKEKEKFIAKLSKIKIKLSAREEEALKALFNDLDNISKKFISILESCERKTKATSSNMFDSE